MARDWVFTSFDTTELIAFDKDNIRYIIYGREQCPTTGREHYQGFAIFKRTCRIPKAKEWLGSGDGIHLESRRGTRDQARDYCRKDGKFIEWGEYESFTVRQLLSMPIEYIKKENPLMYVRYHKGIEKLLAEKGNQWRDVKCTLIWGETNTGKTRMVMEKDSVYKIDPPYKWWDGYDGEKILLLDDYRKGTIDRGLFLNLLDGYRLRLETKGGHTWALWEEVYITSNYDMTTWDNAMIRRISNIIEM